MNIKTTSRVFRKGLGMGIARPAVGLALRVGDGINYQNVPKAPAGNRKQRRAARGSK